MSKGKAMMIDGPVEGLSAEHLYSSLIRPFVHVHAVIKSGFRRHAVMTKIGFLFGQLSDRCWAGLRKVGLGRPIITNQTFGR